MKIQNELWLFLYPDGYFGKNVLEYRFRRKIMNLTVGNIPKKVIRYTIPVILTALVQLLFNAADLVVVGQFCGSASVAAVGSTTSFTHLFIECF